MDVDPLKKMRLRYILNNDSGYEIEPSGLERTFNGPLKWATGLASTSLESQSPAMQALMRANEKTFLGDTTQIGGALAIGEESIEHSRQEDVQDHNEGNIKRVLFKCMLERMSKQEKSIKEQFHAFVDGIRRTIRRSTKCSKTVEKLHEGAKRLRDAFLCYSSNLESRNSIDQISSDKDILTAVAEIIHFSHTNPKSRICDNLKDDALKALEEIHMPLEKFMNLYLPEDLKQKGLGLERQLTHLEDMTKGIQGMGVLNFDDSTSSR